MATIERGPSFPESDSPRLTDYNASTQALQPAGPQTMEKASPDPRELEATAGAAPARRSRRKLLLVAVVAILAIIVIVVLCVYFLVIRPNNKSDNPVANSNASAGTTTKTATAAGNTNKPTPTSNAQPTTGGDGSIITMEDGTTFVYRNPFGGYWVDDPNDPFNAGARAQSWSPALNETFRYGIDRIRGQVSPWIFKAWKLTCQQCECRWLAKHRACE